MTMLSQANFLLIDGALRPGALAGLYRLAQLCEIKPLYLNTRWKDLHDLGPILVKPPPGSTLLSSWFDDEALRRDSTLIYSPASTQDVAEHLSHFICPPDCRGGSGLLRFSDPLVAYHWLPSFSSEAHLGPIEHWWVGTPRHYWEDPRPDAWQVFSRRAPARPWDQRYAMLYEEQMLALEQAQIWRLIERVYAWLKAQSPEIFASYEGVQAAAWIRICLQAGLDWGLVTEQALVIWVEMCADHGVGFDIRREAPYQPWLQLDPQHARLPPETRIKAFANYCHSHKDIAHG